MFRNTHINQTYIYWTHPTSMLIARSLSYKLYRQHSIHIISSQSEVTKFKILYIFYIYKNIYQKSIPNVYILYDMSYIHYVLYSMCTCIEHFKFK